MPHLQQRFGLIQRQKCLCRSCEIQHHIPVDLGEVSPTMCWIVDRHTLLLAVDLTVTHEWAPALISHGLKALRKHYLRQSSTDKRAFVEVQVVRGEVLPHHSRKKMNKTK